LDEFRELAQGYTESKDVELVFDGRHWLYNLLQEWETQGCLPRSSNQGSQMSKGAEMTM
jgi:hypothetical protein